MGQDQKRLKCVHLWKNSKKRRIRSLCTCNWTTQRNATPSIGCFRNQRRLQLGYHERKQSLFDVTTTILDKIKSILEEEKPDIVLVHGDTSTSFVAGLAAFYLRIPVGHVEAGLRTYNKYSPYPEEFNRQAIGSLADFHFAPTTTARDNLLRKQR